jgi:curved DNA-binding protein CbpA
MKDHYFTLGIRRKAGTREIKEAFRMLCLKYHPDKASSDPDNEARYIEICEAYKVLSNREKRDAYDKRLFGIPEQTSNIKEELSKIKVAIYPEIQTSYKGHYPWFAAFAVIIVGALALIFSFRNSKNNYTSIRGVKKEEVPVPVQENSTTPVASTPATLPAIDTATQASPIDSAAIIAKADSIRKIETLIVSTLRQFTPYEIDKVKAASNGGVIPYKERDYRYSFSDGKLFITYLEDDGGKTSKNRIVIPTRDVQTVYYSNNKIWISSRRKSIQVYDADNGNNFRTEFFSVKFDTDNPSRVERKLTEAFQQLKSL